MSDPAECRISDPDPAGDHPERYILKYKHHFTLRIMRQRPDREKTAALTVEENGSRTGSCKFRKGAENYDNTNNVNIKRSGGENRAFLLLPPEFMFAE